MLLLEGFGSAKLCVKGGIENGPMTENGHKMDILALKSYFCDIKGFKIGKNLSKSKRRFDEVETSPRRPARSL